MSCRTAILSPCRYGMCRCRLSWHSGHTTSCCRRTSGSTWRRRRSATCRGTACLRGHLCAPRWRATAARTLGASGLMFRCGSAGTAPPANRPPPATGACAIPPSAGMQSLHPSDSRHVGRMPPRLQWHQRQTLRAAQAGRRTQNSAAVSTGSRRWRACDSKILLSGPDSIQ